MKVLIIFDSTYGNTEKVARAIGSAITGEVSVVRASEANILDWTAIGCLIVGSPVQGFRATRPVQNLIGNIPDGALKKINVAAFDTRMPEHDVGRGLRLIMKMGGYAAPRIAEILRKKGGNLVVAPEGFFVKDKEGPLKDGELERAGVWAKDIVPF